MAYAYGPFNLNDGVNYYVVGKDSPSFTPISQTYYKVGRMEGMKKTGEVVNEKHIGLDMVIIGTSRADMENKIDVMQQALNKRGQNLTLHANDNRYYIADCVDCQIKFAQGNVLYCAAKLMFVAINPYAASPTPTTVDTGTTALTLVSGKIYKFPTRLITGGGTVFCRPVIRLYKRDASVWTNVQITQNTDSQILNITSAFPTTNGGYIDIYCDPASSNGFSSILNSTTTSGALNGVFPVIQPPATSFDIQITTSLNGSWSAQAVYTYTSRWLS